MTKDLEINILGFLKYLIPFNTNSKFRVVIFKVSVLKTILFIYFRKNTYTFPKNYFMSTNYFKKCL